MPEIDRGTPDGVLVVTDARVGLKMQGWLIRDKQGIHRVGTVWKTTDVVAHIYVTSGNIMAVTKHGQVFRILPAGLDIQLAHM